MTCAYSLGAPSETGCLLPVFFTVNSCAGPWNPCVRQPPATAFSNSSQFGRANAAEPKWYTTSPLPPFTALRNAALFASDHFDSGALRRREVIEQQHVILRQVLIGQVGRGGRCDVDVDLAPFGEEVLQDLRGFLPRMDGDVVAADDQQLDRFAVGRERRRARIESAKKAVKMPRIEISLLVSGWALPTILESINRVHFTSSSGDRAEDRHGHVEARRRGCNRGRSRSRNEEDFAGKGLLSLRITVSRAGPTAASKMSGMSSPSSLRIEKPAICRAGFRPTTLVIGRAAGRRRPCRRRQLRRLATAPTSSPCPPGPRRRRGCRARRVRD